MSQPFKYLRDAVAPPLFGLQDSTIGGRLAWPRLDCMVIADAVPLFRDGLARLAEASSPGVNVIQSGSIGEVWKLAEWSRTPGLLLVDLDLPGMDISLAFSQLRRIYRNASIMAMSLDEDEAMIANAMRSGCDGYIYKGLNRERCGRAIGQVLAGACIVERSDSSDGRVASHVVEHAVDLTERQSAVLAMLAEGASNKAIARNLGISHLTVRLHVSSLLRIFGVTRRSQVAPKARAFGLLTES